MDYPKNVPSAGLVNGKFVDEDQVAGTPGSLIPAQWGNAVTEEVLNVISSAGLIPDEDNNAQLITAINAKIAAAMPPSPSDASTTVKGLVELATDAETQAGTDVTRAVTPAALTARTATEARSGIIELASAAETQAGADTVRAVTPATLSSRTATDTRTGLVELATDSEVQAGADSQRAVTPAGLKTAYGLGDSALVIDLNSAPTGYFYASPGATNNPGSGIVFGETRTSSGTIAKVQSCIDVSTKVIYKRTYTGSWSAWTSIMDSATLATETVTGAAKVATQTLTNAGVDDATIVTPKKLRAGFSFLFSATGYVAFPSWLGGLIIQWGSVTRTGTGNISYNFPLTFPNAAFQAVVSNLDVNGVADIGVSSLSTTQITIIYDASSNVAGARYIAIGN